MKQLLLFFVLLISCISLCFADFNSCEEVQTYRTKMLEKTKRYKEKNYGKKFILSDLKNSPYRKILSKRQKKFNKCIKNTANHVLKRINADNKTILLQVAKKELLKLPKNEQMRLLKSILGENSFYTYFKKISERTNKWDTPYSYYSFIGAASEVRSSLMNDEKVKNSKDQEVLLSTYKQSGYDILQNAENPFAYLLSKITEKPIKIGQNSIEENFSPGIAKIILFEIMRQQAIEELKLEEFNLFAEKVKLGIKLPEKEILGEDLGPNFQYSIHNGYFLGSKSSNMNIKNKSIPISFDCTSLIQYCAFGLDSFDDNTTATSLYNKKLHHKLKFITSDFIKAATGEIPTEKDGKYDREGIAIQAINDHFNITKLNSESELLSGDMIVYEGHMLIFKGYEYKNDGSIAFKTIEAAGSSTRSMGELERDPYKPDSNCHNFQWKKSDQVKNVTTQAYRVRIK